MPQKKDAFKKIDNSIFIMQKIILVAIMVPLIFGFLAFGHAGSGSGAFAGFRSANKVVLPTFPSAGGVSAGFAFAPLFRPTFQPLGPLRARAAFSWNFFDP